MPIPIESPTIDTNTLLCFACSSSLPPSRTSESPCFTTPCCQRPICSTCITGNPRLQRYNPCLACLKGVGIFRSTPSRPAPNLGTSLNLDGSVRDEETFVLGDEDTSDYEEEKGECPISALDASSPTQDVPLANQDRLVTERIASELAAEVEGELSNSPLTYHIAQSDTLQGIVLRFGLDAHELCRLNNLPPSTLRTTPHLLHTRHYLILPSSARGTGIPISQETAEQAAAREARRGKERAERRLQTLTKEVDQQIAKAYVALADDPVEEAEEQEEWEHKRKETGYGSSRPSTLEERAIMKYLDDDEWEKNQSREAALAGSSKKRNNGWW